MAETMTVGEAVERQRAVDGFIALVALAEAHGAPNVIVTLKDAIEVRDELERLAEVEESYDSMMSAAEDSRFD